MPCRGSFCHPKMNFLHKNTHEVSTLPCRGSFCHPKTHFLYKNTHEVSFSSLLEPLGSLWPTFAHLWRTLDHLLTPLLHSLLHRCIFMHFGIPRVSRMSCWRLRRGTSGIEVILHLAPLGEALAWVLATFAIYEAGGAL